MPLINSDITFTFSGGSSNFNPDLSLGGEPSVQPIIGKRLFDDISDSETLSGVIDYRCIYINNENAVSSLYEASVFPVYTIESEVVVQLGFSFANERQNLTITNVSSITGGSVTLTYSDVNNHDATFNWDADLSTWSINLQTSLREISNLEDIVVSSSLSGNDVVFEIDFLGVASNRYHEILALKSGGNNLVSSGTNTIGVVKTVDGGPINRVADVIDFETTTPNNVVFATTSAIGTIRPLDSVPIWIKRIVPANITAVENDGFTLRIKGNGVS